MDPIEIIQKHYAKDTLVYNILTEHSRMVADMATSIAKKHPELNADIDFIYEASMLHDIGIKFTHAPDLHCFGSHPYIYHGYLGRELLESEGFPKHALVCERHTGTGLTIEDIRSQNLPIPVRMMMPESIEEKIICYADKFYSKSGNIAHQKDIAKILKSMAKYGSEQVLRFEAMQRIFG